MNTMTPNVRELLLEMRRVPLEKAEQELILFMGTQIMGALMGGLVLGLTIGFFVTISIT